MIVNHYFKLCATCYVKLASLKCVKIDILYSCSKYFLIISAVKETCFFVKSLLNFQEK